MLYLSVKHICILSSFSVFPSVVRRKKVNLRLWICQLWLTSQDFQMKTMRNGRSFYAYSSMAGWWKGKALHQVKSIEKSAVVEHLPRMQKVLGSNPGRIIPKTWKMVTVVAALLLSVQHCGSRATTGRPGVSIVWSGGISGRLSSVWYFSGAAL